MADNNLNNAVAFLGTTLNSLLEASREPVNSTMILNNIPKRSLSGDHISGGKIVNFASNGIKDEASSEQIVIQEGNVTIKKVTAENLLVTNRIISKIIVADVLEVKELKTSTPTASAAPLEFVATPNEPLNGRGILWKGQGHTKQLVFAGNPDKFYSTENFELAKEREFRIDGASVLTSTSLGSSVTKSNLRQVGRLQGLIVDGNVIIDQYIVYDSNTNRLGLGTENPNAGLSIVEDGIEVIIGTKEARGIIGTYASSSFDLVTDSTSRISIGSNGNILLGNYTQSPVNVNIHGKVAIGVKTIDPKVDLHVAGSIKFNDRVHQYSPSAPTEGTSERGSIVWNENPDVNKKRGWVCVRAGSPGTGYHLDLSLTTANMSTVVVIGNGESRSIIDFKLYRGKVPLIGCNAIHRNFYVDHLVCCDRRMVHEAVGRKKSRKIANIYTREKYFQEFLKTLNERVKPVPDLPYNGELKQDLPDNWGSGPYAVLLAATLGYTEVCLLGFDLHGNDSLINNIYKGTQNYLSENAKAVDPTYWIYQLKKIFHYFPNTKFKIYNKEDWACPVEWRLPNVEVLNVRRFTID